MSTSNPNPSRSKDQTTPRQGKPAPTPGSPEKKPEKKIEPTVMVAIISAVVTLVTAILSSPLLLALVGQSDTPPPAAAELGVDQSVLITSSIVEEVETIAETSLPATATETESESTPETIAPSISPEPENPTEIPPSVEPTLASTELPPTESLVSATEAISLFQCLAVNTWFPTPITLNPSSSDGCWNLENWGFKTEAGNLLLFHTPDVDEQRGIYMPISGDINIHFAIQMTEFRSRSNKGGFLHFGIVQDDPFNSFSGAYLSYQQPSPGATSPVRVIVSGSNQATQNLLILEKGFQQDVILSVNGATLTVFIDGEPAGKPVNLPPTKWAFWIGYILPGNAELDVTIQNFTIQAP